MMLLLLLQQMMLIMMMMMIEVRLLLHMIEMLLLLLHWRHQLADHQTVSIRLVVVVVLLMLLLLLLHHKSTCRLRMIRHLRLLSLGRLIGLVRLQPDVAHWSEQGTSGRGGGILACAICEWRAHWKAVEVSCGMLISGDWCC